MKLDYKDWLTKTLMLLALKEFLYESDEHRFRVWFEQGYSPKEGADKYKLLMIEGAHSGCT